jgi:methyl acetate hydrolase
MSAALSLPLVFNPGEKWDYGINIDWVGKAVARAVRCSVTIWRSICLMPIGMKDTPFNLTQDRRTRLAGWHARLRTANGCARER